MRYLELYSPDALCASCHRELDDDEQRYLDEDNMILCLRCAREGDEREIEDN